MKTLSEINNCLIEVSQKINQKTEELNAAREEYLNKEAIYTNEYSKYYLQTKVTNTDWTGSRVLAQATNLAHNNKMEAIKAESRYKRLQGDLKALNSEFDALKEEGYNVRAEIKRF